MFEISTEANPDIIFISGPLYEMGFLSAGVAESGEVKNAKVIISPRGMLQAGALQVETIEKEIVFECL